MDRFLIGLIKVNGVAQSSSVGVGTRLLFGGTSVNKSVIGGVAVSGDHCSAPLAAGRIDDRDLIDAPVLTAIPLWSPRKEG